jgi:hypothetical protein
MEVRIYATPLRLQTASTTTTNLCNLNMGLLAHSTIDSAYIFYFDVSLVSLDLKVQRQTGITERTTVEVHQQKFAVCSGHK